MDSEHKTTATSQSKEVPYSISSFSAVGLMPQRRANLFATIASAFITIPIVRTQPGSILTLLSSPYRISHGMLINNAHSNAMTNLMKSLLINPLQMVTNFYGSRTPMEHIFSVTRCISGFLDNLKLSLMSARAAMIGGSRQEACTLTHLNQLANQLQQLAENVANIQETNEAFRSRNEQKNMLAELEDMKGYLELLYQQLRNEEQRKLHTEEENFILRQSISKYSQTEGSTGWNESVKRESDNDRLNNSFGTCNSAKINLTRPESTGNNPPASIETSMDLFGLQISCLYQEGTIAWARPPRNGDTIVFTFDQPVLLKRFKIGTGHFEYPSNKLRQASVEILLTSSEIEMKDFIVTSDDYIVVGQFDQSGLAEGTIDWHSLGSVQRVRVKLHCDHHEWIIISELSFEAMSLTDERSSPEEDFESW